MYSCGFLLNLSCIKCRKYCNINIWRNALRCTNKRSRKATEIMKMKDFAFQFDVGQFRIISQTNPNKHYVVSETDVGLMCECLDHITHKADCKHIKVVLELLKKNKGYRDNSFKIMERNKLYLCKFCDSRNIVKAGIKKTKNSTSQMYKCHDCQKRFTTNYGFEHKKSSKKIFGKKTQHHSHIHLKGDMNNNKMERLNGEIRDRL